MRSSITSHSTVIVIGGGPAGASAALTLARHGISTLLLEQSDGSGNPDGECLAPSANALLHQLGLYDTFLTAQSLPSHGTRSSWGALASRDFLRDPHGHGWHLDRPAFNAALLQAAENAGARVHRRSRVVRLELEADGWHIHTETSTGPAVLAADFLVDASGRSAIVARQQGVRPRRFDALVAAIAVLESDQGGATDATTLIEAILTGWWYLALLPDSRLVVSHFSDPDLLAQSCLWRPTDWWNHLLKTRFIAEFVASHRYAMPSHTRIRPAASSLLPRSHGDSMDCHRRRRGGLRPPLIPRHRQRPGQRLPRRSCDHSHPRRRCVSLFCLHRPYARQLRPLPLAPPGVLQR